MIGGNPQRTFDSFLGEGQQGPPPGARHAKGKGVIRSLGEDSPVNLIRGHWIRDIHYADIRIAEPVDGNFPASFGGKPEAVCICPVDMPVGQLEGIDQADIHFAVLGGQGYRDSPLREATPGEPTTCQIRCDCPSKTDFPYFSLIKQNFYPMGPFGYPLKSNLQDGISRRHRVRDGKPSGSCLPVER